MSDWYCPDCNHPMKYHGLNGCDFEVSDWGTLDCGCDYFYTAEGDAPTSPSSTPKPPPPHKEKGPSA